MSSSYVPVWAKKIPAGYPAGEGGMVEEIYIHYYRHLLPVKSYTFLKKYFKKW